MSCHRANLSRFGSCCGRVGGFRVRAPVYRGCPCLDPLGCSDAQAGWHRKQSANPFRWLLECGLVDVFVFVFHAHLELRILTHCLCPSFFQIVSPLAGIPPTSITSKYVLHSPMFKIALRFWSVSVHELVFQPISSHSMSQTSQRYGLTCAHSATFGPSDLIQTPPPRTFLFRVLFLQISHSCKD